MAEEVSRREAARRLGVSLRTVDRRIASGDLPTARDELTGRVSVVLPKTDSRLPRDDRDAATGQTGDDREQTENDTGTESPRGSAGDSADSGLPSDDRGQTGAVSAADRDAAVEIARLQERLLASEERVEDLQGQLRFERERYAELLHSLRGTLLPAPPSASWWKRALRRG